MGWEPKRMPAARNVRGEISTHRDIRTKTVARKQLQRALEGELFRVMRGNMATDHYPTLNFLNQKVSDAAMRQLANAGLNLLCQ